MTRRYTEIFKLKDMLEKEGIEFEFINANPQSIFYEDIERYQIIVYKKNLEEYESFKDDSWEYEKAIRLVSVIQGTGTYGEEQDLLEIMGLLTPKEEERDSVCGYLTAENVFNRIIKAMKEGE